MLLEPEDVNPNLVDNESCRTPLTWAARGGHKEVVKMLLQREDVDPNTADKKYGRTPLAWAAWRGHQRIVKMLLERNDVRAAAPYGKHQSPLSLAVDGGHVGVVRVLLEWVNSDSEVADRGGQSSLPPPGKNGGSG